MLDFYRKHKEIINYLVVGGLTAVVSLAVYYGSVLTFLNPRDALQLQAANILSWICAVAFAYVTNRIFVFESKSQAVAREASAFFASRLGTLFMDMAVMFLTVTCLGMSDKIAKLIVQVLVTVANYVLSKFFVFRGR